MEAIRILLAEDHKIVREGTRQLLAQTAEFRVIGEASDGEEAVQLTAALRPDVVVLDVRMPKMSGIECTRAIKAQQPDVRILILSAHDDDRYVFPLLEAGANGYLLKTSSAAELAQAIRTVHAGETALAPRIASKMVEWISSRQLYRSGEMQEGLTEREVEILQVVAEGKSNKEVAELLHISPHTVQVHLRNIYGKLGVNSRTEAVAYALSHEWIRGNE